MEPTPEEEMAMAAQDPSVDASFIDTRRVGDATVTAVSEGGLLWSPRFPVSESGVAPGNA